MTLVEVIVAVALATILVFLVAQTSVQVQGAISGAQLRQIAAQQARSLFVDFENDVERMIPLPTAPVPFGGIHPIQIERPSGASPYSAQANDPPSLQSAGRYGDKVRLLVTQMYGVASASGVVTQSPYRLFVEYSLDTTVTGTTTSPGSSTAPPNFIPMAGNGLAVGRLRRRIFQKAPAAATSLDPPVPVGPVLVENVVSFEIEWVDSRATDLSSNGAGRAFQVFLAPTDLTSSGTAFCPTGSVTLNGNPPTTTDYTLDSTDATSAQVLTAIPIGGQIMLNTSATAPPTTYLVRRRTAVSNGLVTEVLLADRPFVELTPANPITATAFFPPAVIRLTLLLAFGTGPDAQIAEFTREFPVAR
jgi:hypothetical protein